MAAVVSKVVYVGQTPSAPTFVDRLTVAYDATYPTGGEDLGLATVLSGRTIVSVLADGWAGYTFQYNYTTGALVALLTTTGVEVANGVDLSGITALAVTVISQ